MANSIKTYLKHAAKDFYNQSVNPPVVRASTIIFKSMQDIKKTQNKYLKNPVSANFDYGRQGTSTKVYLTPTGFGAVFLSVISVVEPDDEVLVNDSVYSPTRFLTDTYLKKFNIKAVFYNPSDFNDLKSKISKKTKLIFVENPGSNTFEFQDLSKIVALAKKNKIYTAIDNTWGTAYLLKPIKLGFDMSIVSATKYYSGHSDVMGGSLAINKRVFKLVEATNKASGLRLGPDDAYLILRGIRTLDVRIDKHQENALKVSKFLSKQKKVLKVFYPYKKGSQNYKLWKKYYSGKLFGYGFSWGGFESLALYQTHQALGKRQFTHLNKDEHVIRMHIGLEDPKDIISDIKQALKYLK